MLKIGLIKNKKDKKLFLLPSEVNSLQVKGITVNALVNYGSSLDINDNQYISSGAKVFKSTKEVIKNSDIILKVGEFSSSELKSAKNKICITMANFITNAKMVLTMLKNNNTSLTWNCLNTGKHYVFYPLLEQMKGRYAAIDGIYQLMSINGAGKIVGQHDHSTKVKVVVLNGSFAGYEATMQALAMGANVKLLDIDEKYVKDLNHDSKLSDLAKLYNSHFVAKVNDYENLVDEIKDADIFINTSIEPGSKSKKRITSQMADSMKKGSILIDASVDQGFGFEFEKRFSKQEKPAQEFNNVHFVAYEDITDLLPQSYSQIISSKSLKHLIEIATEEKWDEIEALNSIIVTKNQKVINEKIKKELNLL